MAHKGGPKTEAGKDKSKLNAVQHNLTSRRLLVGDEQQEDLDLLRQQWHALYATDNEVAARQVMRAADAEWYLLRVERNFDWLNEKFFVEDMMAWGEEKQAQYQLFQRYLTTAQRTLQRERAAVQQYRREVRAEAREERLQKAAAKAEKREEAEAEEQKVETIDRSQDALSQMVFIVQEEGGATKTTCSPPNEGMTSWCFSRPVTTLLRRWIELRGFQEPPPEYAHFAEEFERCEEGKKMFPMVMTVRSFLEAIEREKEDGIVRFWEDLQKADLPYTKAKEVA